MADSIVWMEEDERLICLSVAPGKAWGELFGGYGMNMQSSSTRKRKMSTQTMVRIAILAAISFVLFEWLEMPIIAFYKLDFSGVPILLAGFAMGPVNGLITLLIKDILGLIFSKTAGVGELADFLMLAAMMLPAVMIYERNRTRKTALIGMITGTVAMTIAGVLLNYFILIPFFATLFRMPVTDIVALMQATVPSVDSLIKLVVYVTAPFNILKGVALCFMTYVLYRYLSPILKRGYR